MIANHQQRLHLFQSHANAWGGFLEAPTRRVIDTANPFSLPAAGGFATERGEAFNFHRVVSHSPASTRAGNGQAARVIDPYEADNYKDADPWVLHRHGWMNAVPETLGGGEPDLKAAAAKKTGSGKKTPGKKKKPRTSGGGGEPDVRKPVPPKSSGQGKKPRGKKPRTSGGGGEPD